MNRRSATRWFVNYFRGSELTHPTDVELDLWQDGIYAGEIHFEAAREQTLAQNGILK